MSRYALDSDILSLLQHNHPQVGANYLTHTGDELFVTVITVEEQLSGWYTMVRRAKARAELARAYSNLAKSVEFLSITKILPFDEPSIVRFESLRALKLGVGAPDLRIAAIALEHGATVVTRNTRDFGRVPGLSIEDWSKP
jgi:tRNA(fMet)-specific endonuclease VapC